MRSPWSPSSTESASGSAGDCRTEYEAGVVVLARDP